MYLPAIVIRIKPFRNRYRNMLCCIYGLPNLSACSACLNMLRTLPHFNKLHFHFWVLARPYVVTRASWMDSQKWEILVLTFAHFPPFHPLLLTFPLTFHPFILISPSHFSALLSHFSPHVAPLPLTLPFHFSPSILTIPSHFSSFLVIFPLLFSAIPSHFPFSLFTLPHSLYLHNAESCVNNSNEDT